MTDRDLNNAACVAMNSDGIGIHPTVAIFYEALGVLDIAAYGSRVIMARGDHSDVGDFAFWAAC
jgi:uncharacterized RDD family membrane protein YckC